MGLRVRRLLVRCLAAWVAFVVVLGVIAGTASAASAAPLPHGLAGSPRPAAATLAGVPASLQAAIRRSLGTFAPAAGYSQQVELTPSHGPAHDVFGYSVALSALGTTALVGAYQRNANTGAAYVFTLQRGSWSQTAELTASGGAPGDFFGVSVALSAFGTTALIGAPGGNAGTGTGYVFSLRGGSWSQTAELTASGGAPGDFFGVSVALGAFGAAALVGAYGHKALTGAAYLFTLQRGSWSQTATLTASGGAPGDEFGSSVALSALGSAAVIGAYQRNANTGAAYVFTLRAGSWSQSAELTASGGGSPDEFGWSVALGAFGTTALIGAPARNANTGAAYVFSLRGGSWSQTAELTVPGGMPNDQFGFSMALSAFGTTALIGAPGHNANTGAAYVFSLRGGSWSQTAELTASHGAPIDQFGWSVALSAFGSTALIGAPRRNANTGAAYVFTGRSS